MKCPLCGEEYKKECPNCKDKNIVLSGTFDLKTGENKRSVSYIWKDEETDCKYFHDFDGLGCINVCTGNEPYSCHRAKEEGLCHKGND